MASNLSESMNIAIPRILYEKAKDAAKESGFSSVDEYVAFLLEEVLKDDEASTRRYSPEEEEMVKERLRALGYIE